MIWFRVTLLIFGTAALTTGCVKYKSSYKGSGANYSSNGSSNLGIDPNTGQPIARGSQRLTEIVLLSNRLTSQEAPLVAVAKIEGLVTTKTPLVPIENGLKFDISGLTAKKLGTLEIVVYEGEKMRFIAKKANIDLTLKAADTSSVVIDDCLILAAPWDGLTSDGGCNWEIEEVK